jgi:aminoglycoside phosphotransferase family enzyme
MNDRQIRLLIADGNLPDNQVCQDLIETHISWVIICQDYVYKLKKPLQLSFLDFSTLDKRKYYCEQELILNRRLTRNVYLDVNPVVYDQGVYAIGSDTGEIVDYALVMRRLDNSREMDTLLMKNKVTRKDILKIAAILVNFHQSTRIIKGYLTAEKIIEDFADFQQIGPFVAENISASAASNLKEIVSYSVEFIRENSELIETRDIEGFTRDCHGDLHTGNIFLLDPPVIFDCIEFNQHLRQIDVLCELAFFCMDLETYGREDLSNHFLKSYNDAFQVIRNNKEKRLLLFYKLYRANVKAKVNAIKTRQADNAHVRQSRLTMFNKYYRFLVNYYDLLRN